MQKQNTLAASFSLQGKGLHSGLNIEVSFNPAPENHGYKIKRVDLPEQPVIDAVAENVINTQRGTVIGRKDIQISTIEHAMAALYAMGVDNCLIEVNAPEFPILDGSARHYVEEIQKVGLQEQNAARDYYIVKLLELAAKECPPLLSLPKAGVFNMLYSSFPGHEFPSVPLNLRKMWKSALALSGRERNFILIEPEKIRI